MEKLEHGTSTENTISRRRFLSGAAAVAATVTVVPRHVLGGPGYKAPSDTLNIACIGVGGKGFSDTLGVSGENIVALCDVDEARMAEFRERNADRPEVLAWFDKAKKYQDYRRMLEENKKTIDAVTVSVPDHSHAAAAMMAVRMGKHAFVQKPLTHTVHEARELARAAKKAGTVTQMGNQGHAGEGARLVNEWVADGAIGAVTEVHCWTNRPVWPQGVEAPTETPSVPPTLDWNLWIGPMKWRPYHPAFSHFVWRGWYDFGTGVVGDMGAHIMDIPYWALDLEYPDTVQAVSTRLYEESYPLASIITYTFPERNGHPPVTLKWYDGGMMPDRPEAMEPGRMMGDSEGGVLMIGDKGMLMCGCYGRSPRLVPETAMQAYAKPERTIPRSPGIQEEWIEAIKKGGKSTTDFSYSAPLTETMLLGNIAIRMKEKNTILEWDGKKGEITNLPEANEFLHIPYREGWTL